MPLHTQTELELFALSLVADFLKERGLESTLETLTLEASESFERLERFNRPHGKPLLTVLEEHESGQLAGSMQRLALEREYDKELNLPGPSPLPREPSNTLEHIHYANILTVTSRTLSTSLFPSSTFASSTAQVLLTGSTDKSARLTDASTGALLSRLDHHQAAILVAEFYPQNPLYVLTAGMDGAHHIVDIQSGEAVQSWKDHTKYIVRAGLSASDNGRWLVTGSYDRTVNIYRRKDGTGAGETPPAYDTFHTITLPGAIESLTFLSPNPPFHPHESLVIGCRDDHRLHYIDLDPTAQSGLDLPTYATNMNENKDDWVSFAPMDLSAHPSGRFLACYTDSKAGRIIIFAARSDRQVKNLYGTVADGFSRPRCCWDATGRLLLATSDDQKVYAFDIATTQILAKLGGHAEVVRGLYCDWERNCVVSCSFDKTVRVWEIQQGGQGNSKEKEGPKDMEDVQGV
ncbi:hypothetical protein HDV00_009876 [Rhizophlyctis rosea]|nr:hypothetical protein HDV00_009876 [Rhizophlyctis rosea]